MNLIVCLNAFIAVVECQGFLKAARKNHVSSATVTKQINFLEHWCGNQLLHRTTRTVKLTPFGEHFYQQAKSIVNQTHELQRLHLVDEFKPQGTIRLNIPSTFNEGLLLQPIFNYLKKNPLINIKISSKPYLDELISNDSDIVITLKKQHSVDIKGFKLFEVKRGLFGAPSYIKNHGDIQDIDSLKNHNCLIFTDKYQPNYWFFANGKKIHVQGSLSSDHFNLLIKAAVSGLGVLNIAEIFVENELKTGALQPILKQFKVIEAELYIYYLRYRTSPLINDFLSYMKRHFTAKSAGVN